MYSKTTIVGHLGRTPQMRYLPDGRPVTNFSVATNWAWTDRESGVQTTETTWYNVSVFGKSAEACNKWLSKGRQVLVEGRIRPDPSTGGPRVWQRKNGSWGASFELTANRVVFLGGKQDAPLDGDTEFIDKEDREEIPF